jgi:hypothetical protein
MSVYLNITTVDNLKMNGVLFFHLACPNNMEFSADNQTCECLNTTWVITLVCTDIVGCVNANFVNPTVICTFCDISKKY